MDDEMMGFSFLILFEFCLTWYGSGQNFVVLYTVLTDNEFIFYCINLITPTVLPPIFKDSYLNISSSVFYQMPTAIM